MPFSSAALIKKYTVQIKDKSGNWRDQDSFRTIEQAKYSVQQLKQQNSEIDVRILSKFTGQVIQS